MNYKIKIKLPKNITKQFGFSNIIEKNLSQLNNNELEDILKSYANHIALANDINNITYNNEKIIWDPTETQKQFLNNYYTQPFIIFADNQTTPGTNNTIDKIEGQQIYLYFFKNQKITIDKIKEKYNTIGINLTNTFRHLGINYYIPDNINNEYVTTNDIQEPTKEIFKIIVDEFVNNNWVKLPLTLENWRDHKTYNLFNYNGNIYNVPRLEKVIIPEFVQVIDDKRYEMTPKLELNELTTQTMQEILQYIDNPTKFEYENFRKSLPLCYRQTINNYQLASYYTSQNDKQNYYIPHYQYLSTEIKTLLQSLVEKSDSIANLVFKDIQKNQKSLFNLEADFQTEFYCVNDPRFITFLKTLQTEEKQNIFNYLFNALKYRGIEKIDGTRNFNLSTHHFNTKNADTPEFQIYYKDKSFYVKSNMTGNEEIESNNFKLKKANFSPNTYKFDAVLQKNNKVYAIIEFDGAFHFRPRNEKDNFIQRLTADQIKCAFYEYLKNNNEDIIIIRIPEYTAINKNQKWKDNFKQYMIKLISQYLGQ